MTMMRTYLHELTDHWINAATDYDAIHLDVTNTASGAGSNVLRLSVDGSDILTLNPDGDLGLTGDLAVAGDLAVTGGLTFAGDLDVAGALTVTDTWNDVGTDFSGVFVDITDTASGVNSTVLRLAVDGSDILTVDPTGNMTIAGPLFATGNSEVDGNLSVTGDFITTGSATAEGYFTINQNATDYSVLQFANSGTNKGDAWIGIPGWDTDALWFYRPDGAGSSEAFMYADPTRAGTYQADWTVDGDLDADSATIRGNVTLAVGTGEAAVLNFTNSGTNEGNAWLGLPSWATGTLYLYGPDGAGGSGVIAAFTTGWSSFSAPVNMGGGFYVADQVVTFGANDSAGAGFRQLRVPNA